MRQRVRVAITLVVAVMLVTSPVVAYIPSGSFSLANDGGNVSTATQPEPVVGTHPPTDPDGDGHFEDVNGDGTLNVVDSQALLAHLTNRSVQNHTSRYDFTKDGRVDASDGQWLYVTAVNPAESDPDDDGINNSREIALGTNAFSNDTDADELSDRVETDSGKQIDTDVDGVIDARDTDSDADRIPDLREGAVDTDGDGTPDYLDTDDDDDAVPTQVEAIDGAHYTHDVDFDDTLNWRDVDADEDGRVDGKEGTTDTDGDGMPAYLDNDRDEDGLPDQYERNVTGTDPRHNNSESPRTAYNESANGVIDGMEDFDQDTLGAYREYTLHTDAFDNDTDDDRLTDGFESRYPRFDPLAADTNGDGTSDGDADPDRDGLDNAAEDRYGTLYRQNDTDTDTLADGDEVALGTDPTTADTDADGLVDPEERRLGTDPLAPDTDGDGVHDGNETFETTTTENETNIELTVRGEGDVATQVSLEAKPNFFEKSNVSAGPTVHVVNRTTFENATVAIPINDSIPESEYRNLSVYKWEGTANDTWTRVETTIKNGTARATVESFSYFTVLDTDEWVNATSFNTTADPLRLNDTLSCSDVCEVQNNTTLLLGGEPSARKITVEQGDRTFEVVPLSNGQSIETFYDYGDAEINSPLPVAKSDKSRLFFWSGPNGLSLVVVHDKPRDGSGAAVSFDFENLPLQQGWWIVEDDSNDFRDGPTSPDWSWTRDNTDGGAFRGGLTNTTVNITPHFNEAATREPLTPGKLDGWQVLTGRATDPRNKSLSLNEELTLHIPGEPSTDASTSVSGDSGAATVNYTLNPGVDDIAILYQTEQTNVDPRAGVEVTGPNGSTVSESLSIGTVGTVREVVNVSALEHGNVTISVGVDGVDLRAQILPRKTLDEDGDGISNRIEKRTWTMPTAQGTSFSTSPTNADTDGDGLTDGEEVEFTQQVVDGDLQTSLTVVRSNPTAVNGDGDDLTDLEERRGWTTYLAITPNQSKRFVDARKHGENATAELFQQSVSSDPLQADADGDRLPDHTERWLGTSPNVADSDGDTVRDYEEYADDSGGDPTIHDYKAPTVQPLSVSANNAERTSYTVKLSVSDQSGFTTVSLYKKGTRQQQITAAGTVAETYQRSFTVKRDTVGKIITGVGGFFRPTSVDVETVDIHNNSQRQTIKGPDTFGQAARTYDQLPISASESGFIGLMAFSSGITTVVGEAIFGLVEMVTHPKQYVEQMVQFAQTLAKNPAIITKLPQMLLDQIREQHETRNPFDRGERYYGTFGGGWSLGYAVGVVAPAAASGGGSLVQKGISSSRKLQRVIDAVDSAVPRRVPDGVRPSSLQYSGRIDDTLPDVNVRTGSLSTKLDDMPGPSQQQVVNEFDKLSPETKEYLSRTEIDAPANKVAVLLHKTGPEGRKALNELAKTDTQAADILLSLNDAEMRWRFVEAYSRSDVEPELLAKAIHRYDSLDKTGQERFEAVVAAGGSNTFIAIRQLDASTVRQIFESDQLSLDQQRDLVAILSHEDSEVAESINKLDTNALDDLTSTSIAPEAQRALAAAFDDLDVSERNALVDSFQNIDSDLDLRRTEGEHTAVSGRVVGDDGALRVTGRFYDDGTELVKRTLKQNSDATRAIFEKRDAGDLYNKYGVNAIEHLDEVSKTKAVKIRGAIGEEILQERLLTNKYGSGSFTFDPETGDTSLKKGYLSDREIPFNFGSSQTGFDGLALNKNGDLVIIETKVKGKNGNVVKSDLGSTNNGRQLSRDWVTQKFRTIAENADTSEKKAFLSALQERGIITIQRSEDVLRVSVNHDKITTEVVEYQDAPISDNLANADSLRSPSSDQPTVDSVEVAKIGDVFKGVTTDGVESKATGLYLSSGQRGAALAGQRQGAGAGSQRRYPGLSAA